MWAQWYTIDWRKKNRYFKKYEIYYLLSTHYVPGIGYLINERHKAWNRAKWVRFDLSIQLYKIYSKQNYNSRISNWLARGIKM